ncbi:ABC transporter permease [Methylomonas montana]|uniref:MlaE family ABC transporter permease n=1 Tax=Methylomonas montana TaxID=3058963 RepID=UPI00265A870D|nr:ABC transporter permease [Methylomonas montana]WKJ88875.1 ABC transporter permease [Methylomonas montana]
MTQAETLALTDSGAQPGTISATRQQQTLAVAFGGDWVLDAQMPALDAVLAQIETEQGVQNLTFSTEALGRWDSMLVTELIKLIDCASHKGIAVDKTTLPAAIQGLLALVYAVPERVDAHRDQQKTSWSQALAVSTGNAIQHGKEILIFVGEMTTSTLATLRGQAHFRYQDLWLYIQECGPSALPIVTLISLLVGLILAFVGAVQLSLFGAQIYIANLVSLGMTREMGGLMTAIIMSGRTGAAYAAQLGTMHVNSEIDALKTMNLDPMAFLVLPRMLALIIIMPLLCLYADLMGIIGGGLVTVNFFDVSLTEYLDRTASAVKMKDFVIGFVKCSVFGILIALSGCMRGMQCGRSASAVGDAGTSAVVTAIVFIVVADSVMTIICNRLGI